MTVLEIFEKVNLVVPIEQRRFFNYFEDSVNELLAAYGGYDDEFVLVDADSAAIPELLTDDNNIKPLYHNAIVDNILFLSGAGDTYKSEFIRKAKAAFITYWNENAKGRRVRRMRW